MGCATMTLPTEHLFADNGKNPSIALLKQHSPQCFDKTAHNSLPHNQNLLIKGDNLEVLKHLKNAYANQVATAFGLIIAT